MSVGGFIKRILDKLDDNQSKETVNSINDKLVKFQNKNKVWEKNGGIPKMFWINEH